MGLIAFPTISRSIYLDARPTLLLPRVHDAALLLKACQNLIGFRLFKSENRMSICRLFNVAGKHFRVEFFFEMCALFGDSQGFCCLFC